MKTRERPKLLLVASRLAYPPTSGFKSKHYNLIKILSRHFRLRVVVVTDENASAEAKAFYKRYTDDFILFRKPKIRFWINALASLFTGWPLQVGYYYFPDVQMQIDRMATDADLVISTLIRTAKYVERTPCPKYLDIVDSIALNYRRSVEKVRSFFWRSIYRWEGHRLYEYEKKVIGRFDGTFFVNQSEAVHWARYGKTHWIPMGVNETLFTYRQKDTGYRRSVAFFGKMNYQPNIDAVLWFVEKCIARMAHGIELVIVGGEPVRAIRDLTKRYRQLRVTGYLPDPYRILNSCFAVVAPMQTGGGMQTKVMECMALGKVVIATKMAAQPIVDQRDMGRVMIVRDESEGFVDALNDVARHPRRYASLGRRARVYMQRKYTWLRHEKKLLGVLQGVSVPGRSMTAPRRKG